MNFTLVTGYSETGRDAPCRRLIMFAVNGGFDKFGFVDDPVDVAVVVGEAQERFERTPFAVEGILRAAERRTHHIANLGRHVAHEGLKQRLLGIEVRIEGPEGDARPLRDPDDRSLGEAALAELGAGRVEDFPHRALAARSPWRLALSRGGDRRSFLDLDPHPPPLMA